MLETFSPAPRRAAGPVSSASTGRLTPAILATLGALWAAGGIAVVALVPAGANGVGFAWAAWGLAHLVAAVGIRSGAIPAVVLEAILGVVGIVGATFVVVFIVGLNHSVARGFDLGATWFSPLNGWATLLVYAALVVANVAMIASAARAFARRASAA